MKFKIKKKANVQEDIDWNKNVSDDDYEETNQVGSKIVKDQG